MEKPPSKFICKLCQLDYTTAALFEEHLWSMLHQKAINNKKAGTRHHCNLCMFESYDLKEYGKHLIGERHTRSLGERRKRREGNADPKPAHKAKPAGSSSLSQIKPEWMVEGDARINSTTGPSSSSSWPHPKDQTNSPAQAAPTTYADSYHGSYAEWCHRISPRISPPDAPFWNRDQHFPENSPYGHPPRLDGSWVGLPPPPLPFRGGGGWVGRVGWGARGGRGRQRGGMSAWDRDTSRRDWDYERYHLTGNSHLPHYNPQKVTQPPRFSDAKRSAENKTNKKKKGKSPPSGKKQGGMSVKNEKQKKIPKGKGKAQQQKGSNHGPAVVPTSHSTHPKNENKNRTPKDRRKAQQHKGSKNGPAVVLTSHSTLPEQSQQKNRQSWVEGKSQESSEMSAQSCPAESTSHSSTKDGRSNSSGKAAPFPEAYCDGDNFENVLSQALQNNDSSSNARQEQTMAAPLVANDKIVSDGKVSSSRKSHFQSGVHKELSMSKKLMSAQSPRVTHSNSTQVTSGTCSPKTMHSNLSAQRPMMKTAVKPKAVNPKPARNDHKLMLSSNEESQSWQGIPEKCRISLKRQEEKTAIGNVHPCMSVSAGSSSMRSPPDLSRSVKCSSTTRVQQPSLCADLIPRPKVTTHPMVAEKEKGNMGASLQAPLAPDRVVCDSPSTKLALTSESDLSPRLHTHERSSEVFEKRSTSCPAVSHSAPPQSLMEGLDSLTPDPQTSCTKPSVSLPGDRVMEEATSTRRAVSSSPQASPPSLCHSTSAPANMSAASPAATKVDRSAKQSEELLSKVLVSEQQKPLPKPNLANARSRLRTNGPPNSALGGQKLKEQIHGLVSDVAKPVWQQKKLSMILANVKKTPDRLERFKQLASSSSLDTTSLADLDLTECSPELLEELLQSCEADGITENIMAQLTDLTEPSIVGHSEFVGSSTNIRAALDGRNVQTDSREYHHGLVPLSPQTRLDTSGPGGQQEMAQPGAVAWTERDTYGSLGRRTIGQPGFDPRATGQPGFDPRVGSEAGQEGSVHHKLIVPSFTAAVSQVELPSSKKHKKSKKHSEEKAEKSKKKKKTQEVDLELQQVSKKKEKSKKQTPEKKAAEKIITTMKTAKKLSHSKALSKRDETRLATSSLKKLLKKEHKKTGAMVPSFQMLDMMGDITSLLKLTTQESKLQAKLDLVTRRLRKSQELVKRHQIKAKEYTQKKAEIDNKLADVRKERSSILSGMTSGNATPQKPAKRSKSKSKEAPCTQSAPPPEDESHVSQSRQCVSDSTPGTSAEGSSAELGGLGIRITNVESRATHSPHPGREEGFRIQLQSSQVSAQTTQIQTQTQTQTKVQAHSTTSSSDVAGAFERIEVPPANQGMDLVPQSISREGLVQALQEINSTGDVRVDILDGLPACDSTWVPPPQASSAHAQNRLEPTTTLSGARRNTDLMRQRCHDSESSVGSDAADVVKAIQAKVKSEDEDERGAGLGPLGKIKRERELRNEPRNQDQAFQRKKAFESIKAKEVPMDLFEDLDSHNVGVGIPLGTQNMDERVARKGFMERDPGNKADGDAGHMRSPLHGGLEKRPYVKREREDEMFNRKPAKLVKVEPDVYSTMTASDGNTHLSSEPYRQRKVGALANLENPSRQSHLVKSETAVRSTHNPDTQPHGSWAVAATVSGASTSGESRQTASSSGIISSPQHNTSSRAGNDGQEKAGSSAKGHVIDMVILEDKLYACISDGRFVIYNMTTCMFETEEDLALGEVKHFALWRNPLSGKMVVFVNDGSRKLVQYNVQGKEFLPTVVLSDDVTCLHARWNMLYIGTDSGGLLPFNIEHSRATWRYDCSPNFSVTAVASAEEGGMRILVTATADVNLTLRKAQDGLFLRRLEGHVDVVTALQVHGIHLVSLAKNNHILIHNFETGQHLKAIRHPSAIATFTYTKEVLAVVTELGNVYFYNNGVHKVDLYDMGYPNIKCSTSSQDMLFLGSIDGFIDAIPLFPSTIYKCKWSHCISQFLRLDALQTHLKHIHIRHSSTQCLWKSCLKNYPKKKGSLQAIEEHVFSHIKDL